MCFSTISLRATARLKADGYVSRHPSWCALAFRALAVRGTVQGFEVNGTYAMKSRQSSWRMRHGFRERTFAWKRQGEES